ncbi:MAG: hemerythrin domain-containing protein [Rubrivivax sp.]|nr:MAG: hemerythrin domain-containing protein [Rubrivivax sp.]
MSTLRRRAAGDALDVLSADHKAVMQLLAEFDELAAEEAGAAERQSLANRICQALTAHAIGTEDVFYPALRDALQDDDLIDDAEAEHDSLRALVEQIESLDARDERFDALVMMLGRAVARHAWQEEGVLFPRVRDTGLDLRRLGQRIARRRDEALVLLSAEAD